VTKASVIDSICQAIDLGDLAQASAVAKERYPFTPAANAGRRYSAYESTRIFQRDGFIDRYSGERLIFPGTLRLLSTLMPDEFPAHRNWKMSESHIVYYELFPTVDHVVPVARGGADDESNWVTTSMFRNAAKGNARLEDLSWTLLPPSADREWDGLMRWFVDRTRRHPLPPGAHYLRRWRAAAVRVIGADTSNEG